MKHIDEARLQRLLEKPVTEAEIRCVLEKTRNLQRLSLDDTATLLKIESPELTDALFKQAQWLKDTIYGNRIVLFAPLYINNHCINRCLYCGFREDNQSIARKHLTPEELIQQTQFLLKRGHMRALMVAGESAPPGMKTIDFLTQSIEAIYSAQSGPYRIKRINVNCAPLTTEEFRQLKATGIGTYQLFQETYHDETYRAVHTKGPKSNPDNRLDAIDRAFEAGIDDYGIGVLYGLYDWRFETLAMMQHIEYLEQKHGVGPHTISVPRIEPAPGVAYNDHLPYKVNDDDFLKIVAILRLAVPYTGIILSTRESAEMRDRLFDLGVSQISAESSTSPGGYEDTSMEALPDTSCQDNECSLQQTGQHDQMGPQFNVADHRSLNELISVMLKKEYIPSFCAACYRKDRTGETFMHLAQPGHIKKQCTVNALGTLQEYLIDFATPEIRTEGEAFIAQTIANLDDHSRRQAQTILEKISHGERDVYV